MIVNLHTHTPRCRHAVGTEEEYVQVALKNGLKTLGFSDHTPYWFPGDYYTHMRMFPEQLTEYANSVRAVQGKYAGQIHIPLGIEAEYYPGFFPDLLPRLQDAGIRYLLLGQHWSGDEIGQAYNGTPSADEEKLRLYCDQVIDAMQTGLFTYFAHPDLLHFVGESEIYEKHMRRLCKEAVSCGMPLEINLLGLDSGRHYPNKHFWTIAAEEGCKVVLGSDAHRPEDVIRKDAEATALEMIRELSLTLIEEPQIRLL